MSTSKYAKKPDTGPCGGLGIWHCRPARHWCPMKEEDVALYVLAGGVLYDKWGTVPVDQVDRTFEGHIALKQGKYYSSVVYNSKCRHKPEKK